MKTQSFLSSRNIGLDLLRAGLILEGVLLHASRSLPSDNRWLYVAQRDPSPLFSAALNLIHTFRMEVFFFLSGMFSALIILRKGQSFFSDNRRKRVFLPLVVTYLFIPPLMYVISGTMNNRHIDMAGALHSYNTIHHLWFLASLSFMSLLVPSVFYNWASRLFGKLSLPALMAALIILGNAFFALKFMLKDHGDFVDLIPVTARFLVYYTAGYALYVNRERIALYANNVLMNGWLISALAIAVWLGFYGVELGILKGPVKYLPVLAGSVLSVMLSYWFVFTFERIPVKENRLLSSIVDSALIIYLFHYPVVIFFSWLLDSWLPANWSIMYVLVDFMIGIVVSVLCYMLIKRSLIASLLFGLKPKARKVAVPLEARL